VHTNTVETEFTVRLFNIEVMFVDTDTSTIAVCNTLCCVEAAMLLTGRCGDCLNKMVESKQKDGGSLEHLSKDGETWLLPEEDG
jgi:hypothetical protein